MLDYNSLRLETATAEDGNRVALFVENGEQLNDDIIFANRFVKINPSREQFEEMKFNLFTRGIEKDILF